MEKRLLDAFFAGKLRMGTIGIENLSRPPADVPPRSEPLPGYHVFSTLPLKARDPDAPVRMSAPELLTLRLSALCWRRYNGPISLITDPAGAAYIRAEGLDTLYDGIQIVLPKSNLGIPSQKFWAAGKLLALRNLPLPCVILDMDLIVWEPLPLNGSPLAAAHTEPLNPLVYPPPETFRISPRYRLPAQWDPDAEPLNTAILYMADPALRDRYTDSAICFMQYERHTPDNGVWCMVFAEQRILAMCAAEMGIRAQTFLHYDRLDEPQPLITHLWTGKQFLSMDKEAGERFIRLCEQKLQLLQQR